MVKSSPIISYVLPISVEFIKLGKASIISSLFSSISLFIISIPPIAIIFSVFLLVNSSDNILPVYLIFIILSVSLIFIEL